MSCAMCFQKVLYRDSSFKFVNCSDGENSVVPAQVD